jgi:hypothetical protein
MAITRAYYAASGTDYAIPFNYQSSTEISVEVGGVATSAWTLLSANTLRLNNPATGVVLIYRNTAKVTPKSVFTDASPTLESADLNQNDTQAVYSAEEAWELAREGLSIDHTDGVNLDARGLRVKDVAQALESADAVNLGQVQAILGNPNSIVPPNASAAIGGNYVAKTAAYTVQNADKGKTVVLQGSAFYQATMLAPATYDADFQVRLHNNDGSRLKTIAINGYSSFLLWPKQSVTVLNVGGAWVLFPREQRYYSATGITLYVDPAGSDTANDGMTVGSPLQNVTTAWNRIRDLCDCPATIQLTAGAVYPALGELDGDGPQGFGHLITIQGDVSMANPPQISPAAGQIGLLLRDGAWATLKGLQFGSSGSGAIGVQVEQRSLCDIDHCKFATMTGGYHISVTDGSDCNIIGQCNIVGNAGAHWHVTSGAKLIVGTVTLDGGGQTVSMSIAFLQADFDARVTLQSPTFASVGSFGGKKYDLQRHSIADSSAVVLPGTVAGTADATSNWY